MYVILCSVSGGVTGSRESLLKSNGHICRYVDRDLAVKEARRLSETMGRNSPARFTYTVIDVSPHLDLLD